MRPRQARGIVVGLVATYVLVVVAIPDSRARPERLLLITLALYVAFHARKRLGIGERPVAEPRPRASDRDVLPAESDVRLEQLDMALARAAQSGEQFARVTRPMLRRLAADRLRTSSGIDVTANPAGARQQMGEDLWAMFSVDPDEVGPAPDPQRLRDLVTALERL